MGALPRGWRRPWLGSGRAWIVWLASVAAAFWLYQEMSEGGPVVGYVGAQEVRVAPLSRGRLVRLHVRVGDRVRAGQVVASLDTRALDREIASARADLRSIDARIEAGATLASLSDDRRSAGLDARLDRLRGELARAHYQEQTAGAELAAVRRELDRLRALVSQRLVSQQELATLGIRRARLKSDVRQMRPRIRMLQAQVEAAERRRSLAPASTVAVETEPLKRRRDALKLRVRQLGERRDTLTLRAPLDGSVAAVLGRTGEVVDPASPVLILVAAVQRDVIACVPENRAARVRLGEEVSVRVRGGSGRALQGRVAALGPQVRELPARCWSSPRVPAWGREVVVRTERSAGLVPGQKVGILFPKEPKTGAAAAAPGRARGSGEGVSTPAAPMLVQVPAALRRASRLELSGLVWVGELDRYLVVSDDTGRRDAAEHAPWLFALDAGGRLDPMPWVMGGAGEVSDLESITRDSTGRLYVLASQSYSKKGRRPASRQRFYRLGLSAGRLQVTGAVQLASLIEAAPKAFRRSLGLGDGRALNIEGLCAQGGGLLLGLRAPLDARGRALIWRIDEPDLLFDAGDVRAAGLRPWARVRLDLGPPRHPVPAGVAEILALPEGGLLLLGTPSSRGARGRGGALFRTAPGAEDGVLRGERLRAFPAHKPEGLAWAAAGGGLVITFDEDGAPPTWIGLPWPIR